MKDKFPEIYKNQISKLKSKVQKEYYYSASNKNTQENKESIKKETYNKSNVLDKINGIFKRNNYVYQADVNIITRNGESITKKVIGKKDNYLLTMNGEKIYFDDIMDIK